MVFGVTVSNYLIYIQVLENVKKCSNIRNKLLDFLSDFVLISFSDLLCFRLEL